MEILVLIALGAVAVWFVYRNLNKEDANGRHPLDALTNEPPYKVEPPVVNNKTGDLVVTNQITDAVTQSPLTLSDVLDVNKDGKADLKNADSAPKKSRGRVKKSPDSSGNKKLTVKEVKTTVKKEKAAGKKPAAMKSKSKSKKA